MSSVQSSALRTLLRFSKRFSKQINADTLAAKRASYARLERAFPPPRDLELEPVAGPGFAGEWLRLPVSRPGKILLYMHGGGFVFDSFRVHRDMIARITRAGRVTTLSLDYSLAPEHPYPVALNETLAAYRWLLAQGHQSEDIILGGDSAGASLVLSALEVIKREQLPFPAAAIAIAAATDAANAEQSAALVSNDFFIKWDNLKFFIDSYFGDTARDDPIASPLYGDPAGFPPLLIHTATNELMHADSTRYAAHAQAAGVVVELYQADNLWHVWHLFARYLPEGRVAIANIGDFIRRHSA